MEVRIRVGYAGRKGWGIEALRNASKCCAKSTCMVTSVQVNVENQN